jgi:predicted RNA-binding protein YlxR (DUF448 family)
MLAHAHDSDLDTGPQRGLPGASRLCAVTRTVKPADEMIRFVVGPDGVVPDLKRKLPGRGIWITATRSMLRDAVRRRVFARGFKQDVQVAADLAELTEQLLARAALDALAIAGKSGLVALGFAKVEAALIRDGQVKAILHAAGAGADGVTKIAATLQKRPDRGQIAVIRRFTGDQLDLALGRPNVVHAALLAGPASDTFLTRCQRLDRFVTGDPGDGGIGRPSE